MPLYSYRCNSCGNREERYLKLHEYKLVQDCSVCTFQLEKILMPAKISVDYVGYECPITGKWIEGKKAHRENLAIHGRRILEKGETQQLIANKAKQEAELDRLVDESVDRELSGYDAQKLENLGRAIESGLDISVDRL